MHGLVIIGGGGAGLTAALTAKKTHWDARITLITNEGLSYSPCALPFVIGGDIDGLDKISRDIVKICEESEINCVIDSAVSIDVEKKSVETEKGDKFPYNSLVIATGGIPFTPPIPGVELDGVYTLQRIEDARRIMAALENAKNAVVIGGGAIGIEMATAFIRKGLKVALIERSEHVLARSLDPDFSTMVENKLREGGVEFITNNCVQAIQGEGHVELVRLNDREIPADIVILGVGLKPNTELAEKAGIETVNGGIKADGLMQTNINDIYAAGDCVDSRSMVTGRLMLSQLGTTATRHGMIAGMNAVGGYATFEGVLNSMVLKIFNLEVGRTGLTVNDAEENDIDVVVGKIKGTTKSSYFPGAKEIKVKLIFNSLNRRLIGAQIAGEEAVADKIDLLAYAIAHDAEIMDLMKLKYCYTPPVAPSHSVIVQASENALKKLLRMIEVRKRRF